MAAAESIRRPTEQGETRAGLQIHTHADAAVGRAAQQAAMEQAASAAQAPP
jgi:hypothetical protein